ncbi:poly [ADP-ribose] polymerase tankyrase-2-like [Lineus longissimus]|uniref:poly [ADP-ribose] polymerase tankyrase-2-like n=1 Tax=Lineus longissimus TaxID=88925 RepID=UPI002B4D6B93
MEEFEKAVKAVKAGKLGKVEDWVRRGLDLEARDRNGWMVLHHVAKYGKVTVAVSYMIGQGVDVNCKTTGVDGFQETPLLISCQEGNMDMVKYLLAHGADIKAKDRRGRNVLHFASESKNLKLVEYFVGQGFDVNCKDTNNSTPLLRACSEGNIDIAKYLLRHGADISARDRWVGNVLHLACEANSLALVEYLVNQGADVNCKGVYDVTPLLISCEKGNIDIVKCLLGHGADIKSKDKRGRTVLSYGRESKTPGIVEYLRSKGGVENIDTITEWPKNTAAPPNLPSDVAVTSIASTTATAIFEAPPAGTYDCFKISIVPWTNGETLSSLVNKSGTTYHALFSNLVPGTDYTVAVGTFVGGIAGTQRTRTFKTSKPRIKGDKHVAEGTPQVGPAVEGTPQVGPAAEGTPQVGPAVEGTPQVGPAAEGTPQVGPAAEGTPQVGPATDAVEIPQPSGQVIIQQIAHVSGTGNIGNIHNEGTFIVNVTNTRTAGKVTNTRTAGKKKKKQKPGRNTVPRNGKASRDNNFAGSSSPSGEQSQNEEALEMGNSARIQHGGAADERTPMLLVQQHDFGDEEPVKEERSSRWCCCC